MNVALLAHSMAEKNDKNIIKRGISLSYSFFRFFTCFVVAAATFVTL